jgi:hypothetical protein
VAFHQSAIEAVRNTLLPAATCPALKAHFNTVLPAFEHHLTLTEATERQLGRLRVFTIAPNGTEATLYFLDPGETCVLAINCLFTICFIRRVCRQKQQLRLP